MEEKEKLRLARLHQRTKKLRVIEYISLPLVSLSELIDKINKQEYLGYHLYDRKEYGYNILQGHLKEHSHSYPTTTEISKEVEIYPPIEVSMVTGEDGEERLELGDVDGGVPMMVRPTNYIVHRETAYNELKEKKGHDDTLFEKVYISMYDNVHKISNDPVITNLRKVPESSVDFMFYDTLGIYRDVPKEESALTLQGKELQEHIHTIQTRLLQAYDLLKAEGGSAMFGVSLLTINSYAQHVFDTDSEFKRLLYDVREVVDDTRKNREYTPDIRRLFWGVRNKGWTFNLQPDETMYHGVYPATFTDEEVLEDIIKHFTSVGDTVLEVAGEENSKLKQICDRHGRNYILGGVE